MHESGVEQQTHGFWYCGCEERAVATSPTHQADLATIRCVLPQSSLPCGILLAILFSQPESVFRWEETFIEQRSTDPHNVGMIHRQNGNGRSPDRTPAYEIGTISTGMPIPLVTSRVKQLGNLPRRQVDAGDFKSLVAVIVEAGEGQVAERCRAPVRAGDDVVDWEWDGGKVYLWHAAVYTIVAGTPSHLLGCRFVHEPLRISFPPSVKSSPWNAATRADARL
jgi:hypothetical protein